MADTDAEVALLIAAKTFLEANGFTGKIGWENDSFEPFGKTQWASVFFVPNQPEPVTLGVQGSDRQTGFLQIDLNVPQDTGSGAMRAWQDAARQDFVAGKTFTEAGQAVVIVSTGWTQGRNVDNWFRKSLTVVFRTDFTRATI
tara:strand:- start:969 stop:1397 length:429 start_codon:yes stop_codon:yes gene_type:complete